MTARAVVIGGGISGLATAALLSREGYDVTVLEARHELGGRAGLWEQDGFRFDTGPSWYLMPEVFDHFYRMVGTSADEQLNLSALDPGYKIYFEPGGVDTAPIEVARSRQANIALFERIEPGAGRRLGRYLDSARETYELAKRHFLYSTFADLRDVFTAEVIRRGNRFVPLLLTSLDRFVARRFRDPRLRQLLGYPAVFLGSSPFSTPSMYHLMSHLDLDDGVLYPEGGIARVIESIADLAASGGADVRTSARATRIVTKPVGAAKPTVLGVRYLDATGEEQFLAAGTVVLSADLHLETALLPEELQTYPESWWQKKEAGPSALLIYLGVRGTLPQLEHHTLLFARDWRANFTAIFRSPTHIPEPASIYVCRPSATDDGVAPDGFENLFVLVPLPADPSIGSGGLDGSGDSNIEALADRVIVQIAEWAGIPDLAERIVLRRTVGPADFERDLGSWRGSALGPSHILTQSAFFRAGNISKRVTGLYYAGGSTIPGIGLPMCLISAELVLKHLRGDTSAGPSPEPAREPR